jgi:hypothetical protein
MLHSTGKFASPSRKLFGKMPYRIATVSFLNCLPLVEWFTTPEGSARVTLSSDLPSRLSAVLATDRADVALLPTVEILRGHAAGIIGGSGIACRGAVDSVKLYHRGPLAGLKRVAVDRGSRTSVALLRILLAETADNAPVFAEVTPQPGRLPRPGEGVLVIGDRCFAFEPLAQERCRGRPCGVRFGPRASLVRRDGPSFRLCRLGGSSRSSHPDRPGRNPGIGRATGRRSRLGAGPRARVGRPRGRRWLLGPGRRSNRGRVGVLFQPFAALPVG